MTDLTATAKKIMEVFRYFRIKKNDILSTKLLLSRRHLWRGIEEETFTDAISELIEKGYIEKMESQYGWRLLETGAEYLKQLENIGPKTVAYSYRKNVWAFVLTPENIETIDK